MYKRILLPLDGSALAERALPHAVALAQRFQAELTLLQVQESLAELLGQSTAVKQAEEQTRNSIRVYLERIASGARKDGISVRVEIIEGHPHQEIVRYAEINEFDLIVICTRGHSRDSRWLMGSVADRVARGADIPVLLVRAIKKQTR